MWGEPSVDQTCFSRLRSGEFVGQVNTSNLLFCSSGCVRVHYPVEKNYWYSAIRSFSFNGLDYTGQPSLTMCINERRLLLTRRGSSVFLPPFLGPLSHQSCSNPYTYPFVLLLTHQLQRHNVPLLPNISHYSGTWKSMLFTSPVSGCNVMADWCIHLTESKRLEVEYLAKDREWKPGENRFIMRKYLLSWKKQTN